MPNKGGDAKGGSKKIKVKGAKLKI